LRNSATVSQPRGGSVAQPVWVAVVENADYSGLQMTLSGGTLHLVELLKQNQAKHIFYALEGPQLDDAIGMPANILKGDKRRREREKRLQEEDEEHRRGIQRKREEEAIAQTILQQRHALQLEQENEKLRLEDEEHRGVRSAKLATASTVRLANHDRSNCAL
jgi:hypothetical protein